MQRSHLLAQAYCSDSHGWSQLVVIAFTVALVSYQLNMHVKYHISNF